MNHNIVLITHGNIGQATLDAAQATQPAIAELPIHVISVENDQAPERIQEQLAKHCHHGDCLILTDLYGATPANCACRFVDQFAQAHNGKGHHCRVVSGLNLGMLLRTINYLDQPIEQLAETAAQGAQNSARCYVPKTP